MPKPIHPNQPPCPNRQKQTPEILSAFCKESELTHFRVLTCQCPTKSLTFGEVMSSFK